MSIENQPIVLPPALLHFNFAQSHTYTLQPPSSIMQNLFHNLQNKAEQAGLMKPMSTEQPVPGATTSSTTASGQHQNQNVAGANKNGWAEQLLGYVNLSSARSLGEHERDSSGM